MHVAAGRLAYQVDRAAHRFDVVVEGALHAALFLLGRAEVDDPYVEPEPDESPDAADVR